MEQLALFVSCPSCFLAPKFLFVRLTEWLNGSSGVGETPSQLCTIAGKMRLRASGREAHPKGAEPLPVAKHP